MKLGPTYIAPIFKILSPKETLDIIAPGDTCHFDDTSNQMSTINIVVYRTAMTACNQLL